MGDVLEQLKALCAPFDAEAEKGGATQIVLKGNDVVVEFVLV